MLGCFNKACMLVIRQYIKQNKKTQEMYVKHYAPLIFDPVTKHSIWFIFYPGWMCEQSVKKANHGVLEFLIGDKKGYQPTETTYAKQYVPCLLRRVA